MWFLFVYNDNVCWFELICIYMYNVITMHMQGLVSIADQKETEIPSKWNEN
jgi:hypothetical protein